VGAAVSFAANAGFRKMTLLTQGRLGAARRIYEKFGFHRVKEEAHTHFGPEIMGEEWERPLC
jgi:ribosomal protein S18 acetylase RimI-like enzyme